MEIFKVFEVFEVFKENCEEELNKKMKQYSQVSSSTTICSYLPHSIHV